MKRALSLAVVAMLLIACEGDGGGGGMRWSDTVQGQYCSDPENGAVAKGLSEGSGESYDSICTKMWAVDRYLNSEPEFDPNAEYDPFAP